MAVLDQEKPPPDSKDLEGWRQAVRSGEFKAFRMEGVIAAIQDLGPHADTAVINALALCASNTILRVVRKLVGKHLPNQGDDLVDEVHHQLIVAMLRPASADGKGLREAFVPRIRYRVADAIRADALERSRETCVENVDAAFDGERTDDMRLARDMESQAYVEEVLSRIPDERHRLAFRLHMERVPLASKKSTSISELLGVSSKTAAEWITGVQEQLGPIVGEQS